MSVDATRWAWMQAVTPTQKLLLLSLADRAGESHECWPSIKRLEVDTGLYRNTIFEALAALEEKGLIETHRTVGRGNRYRLLGVPERNPCGNPHHPKSDPCGNPHYTSMENHTGTSVEIHTLNLPIEPIKEPTKGSSKNTQSKSKRGGTKRVCMHTPARPLPDDFWISPAVKAWADTQGYGDLEEHLAHFKDRALAKGYTYKDWDAALRTAIRADWANLRKTSKGSTHENNRVTWKETRADHAGRVNDILARHLAESLAAEEMDRCVVYEAGRDLPAALAGTVQDRKRH